jgi:hypothetical protein
VEYQHENDDYCVEIKDSIKRDFKSFFKNADLKKKACGVSSAKNICDFLKDVPTWVSRGVKKQTSRRKNH